MNPESKAFQQPFEENYSPENLERFSSKIELKFLRHDQKEVAKEKDDARIRLTPEGRAHAADQASLERVDTAMVFGSPSDRTQETAAYHMVGNMPEIDTDGSFDELREKINSGLDFGKKIAVDPRLAFKLGKENGYTTKNVEALRGGRLLRFLVEESDGLAEKVGDKVSSTYSRFASQIASIVEKYIRIAPHFDQVVHKQENQDTQSEQGGEDHNTMYRFLGTHQGVGECFLAKVIQKTKGNEELEAFLKSVDNEGFGFSESFKVEILTPNDSSANSSADASTDPSSLKIRVTYKNEGDTEEQIQPFEFDEIITVDLVQQIISEGN